MKTIGILITGHLPEDLAPAYGTYADLFTGMLGGFNFAYKSFMVVDGEFPASPHDADAWMITGSKHGVYEDIDWIRKLEAFIRDAYAANVPMVGICFGHQVMAKAMGGVVEKFEGGWNVGPRTYKRSDTGAVQTVLAFHQDQVVQIPPAAIAVGDSDNCRFAVLRYGEWGLSYQPHPEFKPGFFDDLRESHKADLPEQVYAGAKNVPTALDADDVGQEIGRFLDR